MQRIVLACDGTWNIPDQAANTRRHPTNVTRVAEAIRPVDDHGVSQRLYYQRGVGTNPGERLRGGAFGFGLSRGVQDVYRFIVQHYEPGDELFFLGFSRGAYMARSTVGLIRNAGILQRDHIDRIDQAYALYRERAIHPTDRESVLFRRAFSHPDTRIRFIGVWDTVGALGVPAIGGGARLAQWINRRWSFHDTTLSRQVDEAYQAVAIDERRGPFTPTMWQQHPDAVGQRLQQVWFSGVHTDVGGGYEDSGLSDIALRWMIERAEGAGLALDPIPTAPAPLAARHESCTGFYSITSTPRRIGRTTRGNEALASTAVARLEAADGSVDAVDQARVRAALDAGVPVVEVLGG